MEILLLKSPRDFMIAITMLKGTLVFYSKMLTFLNVLFVFKKANKATLKNPALQVSLTTGL